MKMLVLKASIISLCCLVLVFGQFPAQAADITGQSTYHTDGRTTPRLDFVTPEAIERKMFVIPSDAMVIGEKTAKSMRNDVLQFLAANSNRYGLTDSAAELKLVDEQESLLGKHYRYQQFLGGREVITGEIVVTVDKNGNVTRVSNNVYPTTTTAAANKNELAVLDQERALDIAWQDLNVEQGAEVLELPSVDLKYWPSENSFMLVYDVMVAVNKPYGYWQYLVDAETGEIIQKQNRATNLGEHEKSGHVERGTGPVADRRNLFRAYELKIVENRMKNLSAPLVEVAAESADGTALVFDGDPVTTLQDATLRDDSLASAFDQAYRTRPLQDLRRESGVFHLDGPWVRIVDFESPTDEPSTSTDGNWTAKRGDTAFNDAMTYYHIDQTQRYIQSLGFANIIARPIEVDANGVSGNDNSYHRPNGVTGKSGILSFGHGCVDDNEDADVIWHEYGHAVHADVAANRWRGGDTRAMGEGFGDYLAATLSLRKENGNAFQTNKVFNWDGIGTGDPNCRGWSGRRVNLSTDVKYDPSRFYSDHQPIGGGAISDELWASPLFQAQLMLIGAGKPPEDGDKIVIQGMFGLSSSGAKMHELAQFTVLAAQSLFPGDIHAATFIRKFQDYNICNPNDSTVCAMPGSPGAPGVAGAGSDGENAAAKR
ncbi:M36 family metallopeptidase [Rhodobium gokarnense]|uniref:FTP domain-containing protein n=1 Tax=Rhodobium gokarnense TaxID=364296 RepID=A0ABT3HCA0_9HYPH|nr:M36 family metallopeptidase [Rhodobium gokarnense]MCW2308002.1 hypothetical protein [Rhodobium gokarnense]